MPEPLAISVYSDVVCPWCYVGKRRLEAALASPGSPKDVRVSWRPFELNPDLPAEGSYHTLAGLVLALLRRVPRVGDRIVFSGWRFEVLEMDGRRVDKVRASREVAAGV